MKSVVRHTLLMLLSASAILGCGATNDLCMTGARITVVRSELLSALLAQLEYDGVEFTQSQGNEICYPHAKQSYVMAQLIRLDREQRPPGKIEIAGSELATAVLNRLAERGIGFEAESLGHYVIITLHNQEDRTEVRAIIEATARELFP